MFARPILVADDDPVALALISACFDRLRLCNPRLLVHDGEQALNELKRCLEPGNPEASPPALVLLDGQMPGRSGLEVMLWMREQPTLADVPVIMLTADGEVSSIQDAYDTGVSSYLVKPVGFQALGDVLRTLEVCWVLV